MILGVFIASFMSLYIVNKLVTSKNSLQLISESIKVLEIMTSMIFNLGFANNTVLSCFFLFFLIIHLYVLILRVTTPILILLKNLQWNTNQQGKSKN